MLSNNSLCLRTAAEYVLLFLVIKGSMIPPGFIFMELHTLTLAAHSYVLVARDSKKKINNNNIVTLNTYMIS